jgi:hypothetical protein
MQDTMNEEEEEELCYNLSTLKSVADVRKHINSGTVELPATLLGLLRLFNNYCHLLEVLFGQNCPHLVHTRGIRDALDDNEADLETRITQKLCLHLLWRVHHNSAISSLHASDGHLQHPPQSHLLHQQSPFWWMIAIST